MCLKERLQAVADGQIDGTKSTGWGFLEARYTAITTASLPAGWNPECVLFDAMFWLHAPPEKGCTMAQHALTLFQTKLFYYIQRGTKEINIVFDTPIGFNNHPKSMEYKHWYYVDSGYPFDDHIKPLDTSMKCPNDWNLLMECQQCKHNLASYIGQNYFRYHLNT